MNDYKKAVKRYRDESGPDFIKPVESKSVCNLGAWFLCDDTGEPLALVADRVLYGERLAAWQANRHRANEDVQAEQIRARMN